MTADSKWFSVNGASTDSLPAEPDGQDDWRPHEKSRSLGELATHIAQLPGFGIMMLTRDEFDGAQGLPQPTANDNEARLKMFDEVAAQLRSLVDQMTWDHARSIWTAIARDRLTRFAVSLYGVVAAGETPA